MATVCKECRNCDWFWEDRDSDKECLGEEQPCERYKDFKQWGKAIVNGFTDDDTWKQEVISKIEDRKWTVEDTVTF